MDLNFNDLDLDNLDISSLGSFQNQLQNLEIGPLSQPQSMNASAQNSVNNPSINYNPYQIPPNQYQQQQPNQPPSQHTYPPHINGNNQSPDAQSNGHSGSNGKIPNGQNGQIYYPQQPQTEAKKIFEEKYKEAIENKTASNNSSSTNSISKPVHAKIVAPTNIHPQHKSQTIKAVPAQPYVPTLNNNNNNNTNTNIT